MNHQLPIQWIVEILRQPESGMGYWTGDVTLRDGSVIQDVLVVEGQIMEVRGYQEIPFDLDDIVGVTFSGRKWKWGST
jgi:hypothetical protein